MYKNVCLNQTKTMFSLYSPSIGYCLGQVLGSNEGRLHKMSAKRAENFIHDPVRLDGGCYNSFSAYFWLEGRTIRVAHY